MATLTETAYYTRRGVKLLGIIIVVVIVLKFLWFIGSAIWLTLFPPPPPPPTLAFGPIPKINFYPAVISSASAQYSYTLETIGGKLPKASPTVKVYFLPTNNVTFGDFDKMRAQAARMGFIGTPSRNNTEVNSWHFDDLTNPLRHLDYNATTGNFHLYYDFGSDLNLFSQKNFGTPEQITAQASSYLSSLGLLVGDLATGGQTLAFLRLDGNQLVAATGLAEADAVSVNFFRQPIQDGKESYPVVTADPQQSLVSVMFSGSATSDRSILQVKYYYSPLDRDNWATYPVITPQQAFDTLKAGGAYVTGLLRTVGTDKQVTVRKVYLAYFDPFPPQQYLEPVYVFSDEQGFMAYVPAVTANWLK